MSAGFDAVESAVEVQSMPHYLTTSCLTTCLTISLLKAAPLPHCLLLASNYALLLKPFLRLSEVRTLRKGIFSNSGLIFRVQSSNIVRRLVKSSYDIQFGGRTLNSENQLPIWKRFLFAEFRLSSSANIRNGFTTRCLLPNN